MSKEASLTILDRVDLKQKLAPAEYERRLEKAQGRLGRLVRAAFEKKRSSVVVFEGWDASGKGGNIRRLTAAMDPRTYRVISVAAPTDEEKAHHYLWRFWRHVPARRLRDDLRPLLVRAGARRARRGLRAARGVEPRLPGDQRLRAAARRHGIVLAKFWLHVDAKEQLRRFKERETVAWKRHKIGARGLAQPREVGRLRGGGRRHDRAHEHGAGAVDARGRERQALRPGQVVETLCARLEEALDG